MINSAKIENYKSISGIEFCLRPLTLLTGTNSVGKSSFLQCILLARLAALASQEQNDSIPLNGPYGLSLGEFDDILPHEKDGQRSTSIVLEFNGEAANSRLTLTTDVDSARYANAAYSPGPLPDFLPRGLGTFCYLAAERAGPRDTAELQSSPKDRMEIGFRGQYVANVLQVCERDVVPESIEHPSVAGQRFSKQAEAWLSSFVPGVEIRVEAALDLDVVALRFKRGGIVSEWERPSNTGFGVSYCLPIVVAAMAAKPRSLLLVDSPEAHLHPSGQSAMGSFLGRLAASGVQVILETHSDHVINGIRLAAVDEGHPLSGENVIINHLRNEEGRTIKEEVTIDPRGNLSRRPDEFFDQSEKDLAAIVKRRFPSS